MARRNKTKATKVRGRVARTPATVVGEDGLPILPYGENPADWAVEEGRLAGQPHIKRRSSLDKIFAYGKRSTPFPLHQQLAARRLLKDYQDSAPRVGVIDYSKIRVDGGGGSGDSIHEGMLRAGVRYKAAMEALEGAGDWAVLIIGHLVIRGTAGRDFCEGRGMTSAQMRITFANALEVLVAHYKRSGGRR